MRVRLPFNHKSSYHRVDRSVLTMKNAVPTVLIGVGLLALPVLLAALLIPSLLAHSQTQTPAVSCGQVLSAVNKNLAACLTMGNDQACYANPAVKITGGTLANIGDTITLSGATVFTTSALDLDKGQWGITSFRLGLDNPNTSVRTHGPALSMIQYGAASLSLANPTALPTPNATPALCLIKLKRDSLLSSAALGGKTIPGVLTGGTLMTIDGRLSDNSWVFADTGGKSGWLTTSSLASGLDSCGADVVPVITTDKPANIPALRGFYFSVTDLSGEAAAGICRDVPDGGLLIQSPSGRAVTFSVDGVQITLNSASVVLSALPNQSLEVGVIAGVVTLAAQGRSIDIPVGKRVGVPVGGTNGLEAIGEPGNITDIKNFGSGTGIYLKSLCGLAVSVQIQIPCTLVTFRPTSPAPQPADTPNPGVP